MNTEVLLFVVPPIAGAIIAYITNVIAIRMLFRPLKEIRVFGMRVPFTPGVLPRQREKLAQSIGAMVERELITAEVLRNRLSNIDINGFSDLITDFLRRDDIKKELESKGRILLRDVFFKLNSLQRLFLSAGQYDQTLDEKMPEIINELIASVEKLLKEDRVKRKLLMTVDGQIENILASIDVKKLVSDRINSLDMLRVERIILDVMTDQFKWIYFFGGALGFLIGLFQATFTFLLR
ncbi:MAG: DUF445 family protein [Treponema sp.]|nr:DUF445 family protein [Treponema sp.]